MYKFGKRSLNNLATCHPDFILICNEVLKHIDFSIIEGYRSLDRQKELYDSRKSRIDGIRIKGKHNYSPSLAIDIIPYEKGKNPFDGTDDSELMFYRLNRQFRLASKKLKIDIEWGGDWRSFIDMPHYELKI